MPDLSFEVRGAAAVPYCATPTLALTLHVTEGAGDPVEAITLDCQVRIDAQRRRYTAAEKERLVELFGEPSRWAQTLRSLLWTHTTASVPPFTAETEVQLELPCTADFNQLAGKYFAALEPDGTVPISLLFAGSVFYRDEGGYLQVTRIPWSAEATHQLRVAAWRDLLQIYYPNTAYVTLRQDVFDELYAYRTARGIPTWEGALEGLLAAARETTR
ncbi:MAG: DUF6084 family protein [Candidatus Dormiibacterota bacterium]